MPNTIPGAAIVSIIELLREEYGHQEWRPHRDPLSELVLTILSQHTSDINSGRAFRKLVERFEDWGEVRDADPLEIALAINSAGLGQIKSVRIKSILCEVTSRLSHPNMAGGMDISFLAELPLAEAKAWLRTLPGVGPKTAACVLLFSLGQPALPVDTHVHRISRRLGLVDPKAGPERTEAELEGLVPPDDVYDFHISLISHGRRICKAQRPRCSDCILARLCPSYGMAG